MGHTITILSIVLCTSVRAMERMDHEEQWQSDQQDCKLVSNRKSLMNEYHLPQCETAQEAERPSTPTEVHDLVMWDKMDDQYDGTLTDEETSGSSHQTQAKSKMTKRPNIHVKPKQPNGIRDSCGTCGRLIWRIPSWTTELSCDIVR